jgi:hypothetical protein
VTYRCCICRACRPRDLLSFEIESWQEMKWSFRVFFVKNCTKEKIEIHSSGENRTVTQSLRQNRANFASKSRKSSFKSAKHLLQNHAKFASKSHTYVRKDSVRIAQLRKVCVKIESKLYVCTYVCYKKDKAFLLKSRVRFQKSLKIRSVIAVSSQRHRKRGFQNRSSANAA